MKLRRLLYGLCLLSITLPSGIFAQSTVDVTALTADTKTFIFSDNKNTVKNYIYEELKAKTQCNGTDRIYLEVKIAPSGHVLDAKTLTGKNECFKKSAIDIVKNIKWDASSFKGPKSVYFEIKPEVDGEARDNTYAQLPLFNNTELDVNGVPISYPGSLGTSASQASGGTPTGVPSTPPPASTAQADAGGDTGDEGTTGGDEGTETTTDPVAGTETTDGGDPPAENTDAGTTDPPAQPVTTNTTRSEPTSNTDANTNATMAEKMAATRTNQQNEEIAKLKKQLADMKAAEEEKKEAARRAEEQKERDRIAEAQARKAEEKAERDRIAQEEADERRRQREEDRERIARNNSRNNNSYDNDPYAGNSSNSGYPTDPPPRAETPQERAQNAQRQLEADQRALEAKIREAESARTRAIADQQRFQQDLLRNKEQFIDKQEEIAQLLERDELDRLLKEKQKADEIKREQQRIVQQQMDDMRRLQAEVDRKMQELQRLEADLAKRTQEEEKRAQEIAQLQTVRSQQNDNQKALLRLEYGGATGTSIPATNTTPVDMASIDPNDPNAKLLLEMARIRAEVTGLRQAISNGGGIVRGGVSPTNTRKPRTTPTRSSTPNGPKNAQQDKSWKNTQIIPPGKENEEPWVSLRKKQEKKSQADKEHENLAGPRVGQPSYQGGEQAMKELIALKLKEAGVCGLAQAAFEVTVDGQGGVRAARVINANDTNVNLQLNSILPNLQFEPQGNRIPVRAIYQFKAEIVCDGQERSIDLQSVDDLIKP